MKNPILKEIKFDKKSGTLVYKGIRYILIRPATVVGIEKDGSFTTGMKIGKQIAKYLKTQNLTAKQILSETCKWGTFLGWGNMRLISYNEKSDEVYRVEVKGSPFAEVCGKTKKPVCKLIAGIFSGINLCIFEPNTHKSFLTTELKCVSAGSESCIFVCKYDYKRKKS